MWTFVVKTNVLSLDELIKNCLDWNSVEYDKVTRYVTNFRRAVESYLCMTSYVDIQHVLTNTLHCSHVPR